MVMHLKSQEDNIVGHVVSYTCPILVSYLYKIDKYIMSKYIQILSDLLSDLLSDPLGGLLDISYR